MPAGFQKPNVINAVPRPIHTNIKSERFVFEPEHPVRWSFMKILREYSTLREFYPEINPYTEAYKVRDNTWAFYNDSFDGVGDVWMYLINGPEKAMIVDTSFGVGDLKGLIRHLVGDKEIICVNTHSHYDHCYGNAQFGKAYCSEYEKADMLTKVNPHIWDYLFNQTDHAIDVWGVQVQPGEPLYTKFDKKDIIEYHPWEVVGVPDGYQFDLGKGYIVELVLLPGHTIGMSGYYDHQTGCLFGGDLTSAGSGAGKPAGTYGRAWGTVEGMAKSLTKLQPRFKDISGVFPGHGAWDVHPICLQYLLDTCNAVLKNPQNYDTKREGVRDGRKFCMYTKNIHQWTALRYNMEGVYMAPLLAEDKAAEAAK